MKKLFTLFTVLVCMGMMQSKAQIINIVAIADKDLLYAIDSMEFSGLDKTQSYDLGLYVGVQNNTAADFVAGDTINIMLSLNTADINLAIIVKGNWAPDSTTYLNLRGLAFPASAFKEGKYANEICCHVTEYCPINPSGVHAVNDPGYCGHFTTEFVNGVAESAMDAISLYPNPVRNNLTIENADNVTVNIYAVNGQMVKSLVVNGTANVDMSDLSNGMYIVKMQSQGSISTKKIQVNH